MKTILHLFFATLIGITFQCSAATSSFNADQVQQIQTIIHDYLVSNPQVLVEASKKLQEQEMSKEKAQIEQIKANVPKFKQQVFDLKAPGRVVLGNPNGKIIVAEFTQYQCGHCKAVAPLMEKMLKANPDVQLVLIYWPFFGNDAVYAAKMALAAKKQNKFNELSQAMFAYQDFLNKDKADELAKTIPGLDSKKLQADMNSTEIDNGLKANLKLAQESLNLIGTPTIAFANREMTKFSVIPGQTPNIAEDINRSLNEVR